MELRKRPVNYPGRMAEASLCAKEEKEECIYEAWTLLLLLLLWLWPRLQEGIPNILS